MTTIYSNPEEFTEDQLAGFRDLYSDRLRQVTGGVVALEQGEPQVAVVVGGGSGHYPAFAGLVGPGFARGAVVGNIFTSPSAAHVYNVARAAEQGRGVILTFGNYAGDVMNFGIAAKKLNAEGIDTRIVLVTDDIASAEEESKRRGIAGDFTVFKAMGAAAQAGMDIDDVERLGQLANERTRSLGVAFSGCTMPGADQPLFTVPEGQQGLGLGIHGEPGIRDEPRKSADELAAQLVDAVLEQAPSESGSTVAPILNGLGTTKYEELFLLWGLMAPRLRDSGLELVEPEVGELVTSLDMGGCSLTLMWLDAELESLWRADAYAPGYRKQAAPLSAIDPQAARSLAESEDDVEAVEASEAGRDLGARTTAALRAVAELLTGEERRLGEIDAIAGDGDHGRGMVRGINAALDAAEGLNDRGPASVLSSAGRAWAEKAGGTSGVLWGAALEAAAAHLPDDAEGYTSENMVAAARAFADSMAELGGAQRGDKTMLDVVGPFVDRLDAASAASAGDSGSVDSAEAWRVAAEQCGTDAEATADLVPKVGRARPLAEKSKGHPDAGATSMAMIIERIGQELT